ncbi:serine protease [Bradyrhizobium sp. CCGUVB4N]|uniref:S1 family peptidase n=1 Tax=Bradyrhizobium sp. CCGUVB4N TaxID=2949631 RepID=UPI0020B1FD59|nr:trypsin-like peptidase domain-containing protein [Bradyrhizobium sp. CCGUVB4N]MCP3384198.1 serine protease [Bradyrhizobium sp. CCGUVB4N]
MSYDSGIYKLLRSCTVKITSKDLRKSGSGFFVAPGLVATCAHVVSNGNVPAKEVVVRREGKEWTAKVRLSSINPKVDVALLEIDPDGDSTPEYVCWGDVPESGNSFYSFGFPIFDSAGRQIPTSEIRGESVTVEYEGVQQIEESNENLYFQKFKGGQVIGGSSGAPLLNQNTWHVCGIMKRTRDGSSNLGGTGIPISYLLDCFPELKTYQLKESALWRQSRENQVQAKKRDQQHDRERGRHLRSWARTTYVFLLFSLIVYWSVIGFQSWHIATLVYSEPGSFQDQPIFRILNYDPQKQLQSRLSDTRLFANYSYREFQQIVSFREIPIFVIKTPFYYEPYNKDKYVLHFNEDWYLKAGFSGYGAQLRVREDTAEYSDEFAVQNKCLEEYKRRLRDDREHKFIEVVAPPFRSLGFLLPQEACWLFLETFAREASFSELLDRAKRVREWKETVFLIPEGVGYRAELTGGRTVTSSTNDYFQPDDLYALSTNDCSTRDSCVAYGDSGRIRRTMRDTGGPRRAVGIYDDFFMDSHVSTKNPIKDLSLWFWLKVWPERVPEEFTIFDIEMLEHLRNFPMRVGIVDAGLSKLEFAKRAWTTIGRYASVSNFGLNIDTFVVFIGVLIAACMDCAMLIFTKVRTTLGA